MRTINTISGGVTTSGLSGQTHKAYAREVCFTSHSLNKKMKSLSAISFSDEYIRDIKIPHENPPVVTLKVEVAVEVVFIVVEVVVVIVKKEVVVVGMVVAMLATLGMVGEGTELAVTVDGEYGRAYQYHSYRKASPDTHNANRRLEIRGFAQVEDCWFVGCLEIEFEI
ncbi:hypothetical protein RJ639_022138 [Escallonia herrerae]|uniref:Uncharacterized protein n=1 Tax=Escallonia herrerae TaxID=1293975 RepID=A0AA88V2W2_9ASTE|nr:hypothetical protein RJ639_022138 [Escallonia herrerae]